MADMDFRELPVVTGAMLSDYMVLSLFKGESARISVGLFRNIVTGGLKPSIGEDGYWYVGDVSTEVLAEGKTPEFRKAKDAIEFKYTTEDDSMWRPFIPYDKLRLRYDDLNEEQIKALSLKYEDLTPEQIKELQKPAQEMIDQLQNTNEEAKTAESERKETFILLEAEVEEVVERAEKAAEKAEGSVGVANEALQMSKDTSAEFENVRMEVEDVKSQVESEFTIWFYDPAPTLDNKPAIDWETEELKRMHDQDLYFSDSLAKVWRFINGEWVEITDETTLAVLRRVTDLEFLRNVFASNASQGGISMNGWVGIPTSGGEPKSFLNGGDLAQDKEHGKLFLAGGVPNGTGNIEERSRNSVTRLYEDGLFVSENAIIKGSIRTPWKELAYKRITSSSATSAYGYDGTAVMDDRIIINPQEDSELTLGWGSVSDGRDVIIRVNNISDRSIYIKPPTDCFVLDNEGNKASSGESFVLNGGYIYYLTGAYDCWIVNRKIRMV